MHSVVVFKQRKDLDASDTNLQQWNKSINIPGLLPPQVVSCCSALHFPSYKQGKLMVVTNWDWLVYLPCHLPTDFHSMWSWIAQQQRPVCTCTQSHPVLWFTFIAISKRYAKHIFMICLHAWAQDSCNHGNRACCSALHYPILQGKLMVVMSRYACLPCHIPHFNVVMDCSTAATVCTPFYLV